MVDGELEQGKGPMVDGGLVTAMRTTVAVLSRCDLHKARCLHRREEKMGGETVLDGAVRVEVGDRRGHVMVGF